MNVTKNMHEDCIKPKCGTWNSWNISSYNNAVSTVCSKIISIEYKELCKVKSGSVCNKGMLTLWIFLGQLSSRVTNQSNTYIKGDFSCCCRCSVSCDREKIYLFITYHCIKVTWKECSNVSTTLRCRVYNDSWWMYINGNFSETKIYVNDKIQDTIILGSTLYFYINVCLHGMNIL